MNGVDAQGRTALHAAAESLQLKAMEFLLRKGADVNAETSPGWTPLMAAIDAEVIAATEHRREGEPEAAVSSLLIRHRADVWRKTSDGMTPLLFAQRRGHQQAATILREAGAA